MSIEELQIELSAEIDSMMTEAGIMIRKYLDACRRDGITPTLETFIEHMALISLAVKPHKTDEFIRSIMIGWIACNEIWHGGKP